MNKKNKNYIILFVGIVVILIIFVGIVFFQQTANTQAPAQIGPNTATQQSNINNSNSNVPTISLPPLANNPKAATQQFYNYYFASTKNPLSNGAYKASPYLSPEFKDTISKLYNNGDVAIFCTQNKSNNITVGNEQTLYYNNSYLTEEIISDVSSGKKLYDVLLENNNNHWQFVDINCIY